MSVFFEKAGFVFFENGSFSNIGVCFMKIRVFLENGCVLLFVFFYKWVFFKNGSLCFKNSRFF